MKHIPALAWATAVGLVVVCSVAAFAIGRMTAPTGQSAADHHREWSKHFVSEVTRAGMLKDAGAIEQFVTTVDGATREQAADAFFAVSAGGPDVPLERQMAVTRHAAPQAALYERALFQELCRLCGFIAAVSPHLKDDDVVDVGVTVFQQFQKYTRRGPSEKVLQAVRILVETKAASMEEAFATAIELARTGGDPDTIHAAAIAVLKE